MVFPSFIFLFLFLPLVLFFYYVVFRTNTKYQNAVLLISSLVFYLWGEPLFIFAMIWSIVINWLFGITYEYLQSSAGNERPKSTLMLSRLIFIITMFLNLIILVVYKYLSFIIENVNHVMDMDLPDPKLSLPIGISFFTFQAMSYSIDVYRKNVKPQRNLSYIALYISLFPQLVAGPIVRYQTIEDELENRKFSWDDFSSGFNRFIFGLGKKVIIANTIALAADSVFEMNPDGLSVISAWFGVLAYALQIYFDFSAYSDMAIGLGLMFGFHFLENFNLPYISKSISEFWRRWHISMSTWFRDYVYFPLGGSRVKKKSSVLFNLFAVWALTGLWHGANWTFILWGLMFFVLISLEKLTAFGKFIEKHGLLGYFYTVIFILLGWVFFRSPNIQYAADYIKAMFGLLDNSVWDRQAVFLAREYVFTWVLGIFIALGGSGLFVSLIEKNIKPIIIKNILSGVCVFCLLMLSVIFIAGSSYNPFIYFNF